mgnify:CR=1 FL=1
MYLRNGEQSIHLFIILVKSFNLSFKAFLLYVFCILLILAQFVKDEASILPLSIALLIPMQIYGAIKYKRPYIYILSAILTYAAALLTLSRNAMIFATAALLGSVVVGCFYGKRKKAFRRQSPQARLLTL